MACSAGRVCVFGSANQDLVFSVADLPRTGETVLALSTSRGLGGKGANQAVAAAAAGAGVVFIGTVGNDEAGDSILANLADRGVDTSWVRRSDRQPSGLAAVMVDRRGHNQITVATGANSELSQEAIRDALRTVEPQDVVVLQCEIPIRLVDEIVATASATRAVILLNAAPSIRLSEETLAAATILIVNESEARALAASPTKDAGHLAVDVAAATGTACIVTLGEHGSSYAAPDGSEFRVDAHPVVNVVDTTGAGDMYVGTLAARLARGDDVRSAMTAASVAAADSVSSRGAQAAPAV